MDKKTEATMSKNLFNNTGKSLNEWIEIARESQTKKHGDTVKWLKETHQLGLFFADLIVHKANGTDAGSFSDEELISMQYKGKENLKPIYDNLIGYVLSFGNDIEIVPKKAYVSLRRKKQFACLKPATKTRFEIELILKGQKEEGVLKLIEGAGAMCTHKIKIESEKQLGDEVYKWIKTAYEKTI